MRCFIWSSLCPFSSFRKMPPSDFSPAVLRAREWIAREKTHWGCSDSSRGKYMLKKKTTSKLSVYPHDEMRIRITTAACLARKHSENQNKRRSLVPQWAPNKPWFISPWLIGDSGTMSSRQCVLEQLQYDSIKQTGQHTHTMTLTVARASVSVHVPRKLVEEGHLFTRWGWGWRFILSNVPLKGDACQSCTRSCCLFNWTLENIFSF